MPSWAKGAKRHFAISIAAVMMACSQKSEPPPPASEVTQAVCGDNRLTYENFGGPFFLNWCTGCHSSKLGVGERQQAPMGFDFDTLEGIRTHQRLILATVVETNKMPPAGGVPTSERELLREWLGCGAPAETATGFSPPVPAPIPTVPPATGACAKPVEPLAAIALPRCAAGTLDCALACAREKPEGEVDACRDACLKADTVAPLALGVPYPIDCSGCAFHQLAACAGQNGCQDQVANVYCCIESCIAKGDPTCFERECQGAISAFGLCTYYQAPACGDYVDGPINSCFAPAPGGGTSGGGAGGGSGAAGPTPL